MFATNLWESILGASIALIVLILLIAVVAFLRYSRTMKKQKDRFTKVHTELQPGVRVIFGNGMYGTVREVREQTVDIAIKSGAVVEVSRYVISEIL